MRGAPGAVTAHYNSGRRHPDWPVGALAKSAVSLRSWQRTRGDLKCHAATSSISSSARSSWWSPCWAISSTRTEEARGRQHQPRPGRHFDPEEIAGAVHANPHRRGLAAVAQSPSQISTGHAAEIKVISANGMREVLAETKAKFEADTGHQLTITVVETGEIRKRVLAGENFDVIMVPQRRRRRAGEGRQDRGRQRGAIDPRQLRPRGAERWAEARRQHAGGVEAHACSRAKTVLITDPATGGISGVHLMEVLGQARHRRRDEEPPGAAARRRLPRRPRRQGRGRSRGAGRARDPLRQGRDVPALSGGVPAHHRVHGRRRLGGRRRRGRQGLSPLS